ncbi:MULTISPECIES: Lrp/AsnC family transcriptional regulator [Tatumella]|uniref:Lrp/AsnC family transcriptional regulator n=1 Tax=Tatumella punctata TaxID=399969 RepID=A0ABW1VI20_9GAMM|nr:MULTISPECIES: Lrp/AsnC family transcriptional regulator [unclassified Tatumella]MBS0855128.1 Lrp/AsnC family transcriptional regulator [Tatumella sp. JGM16]MBS0876158.1 Lrp/AsnC family transcriptional regulator [Tatumella sp. JGM82]MBS0889206.1 Lrp/AsnC family transcriptional regulator [Tatumella sp. JGM94]MBS0892744.1 Lrp/AsnC family transcriptional regulator [Tatumella sp. JGM130]MBS0901088.1 Lrp/AsnC family transcriptional regulator [Tatumella sp. JGM100]
MNGLLKLDRLDISILAHLQKDGRISNVNLAEAVGLSPSPCLQRVKRLEAAGFIGGYEASLNLAKITESVSVFTEVTLNGHRREDFQRFEHCLSQTDELMECHLITGGYDYLLRFLTRSIEHYQEVIEGLLDENIGIGKYFSYIVIKSPILKKSVPLYSLLEKSE